jgi:hypothetical protein
MTGAMKATLLAIALVMIGMAASFIWFVATWDKSVEEPIVQSPFPSNAIIKGHMT